MAESKKKSSSPSVRPRRLRRGGIMRDLVADVRVTPDDLVMPLFVRQGKALRKPVASMPGVEQLSPDEALKTARNMVKEGLRAFILFGVTDPKDKDATGSSALEKNNPVHTTLRQFRDAGLEAALIADLCLCEYTDHGHCGVLHTDPGVVVDNDKTLELLGRQAVLLARSGADVVAPSAMMDGQVGAVRCALDEAGLEQTAILAYAIKYASSLYGPFRAAGEGAPSFGDRRSYQMDHRRRREWRTELDQDLAQGADMVMVKPAATYLDILCQVRQATDVPVVGYHVSGEYAMLCAAAEKGWIDFKGSALEITTAIKRAGADLIITYLAPKLLQWL